MTHELQHTHRPQKLSEVVGQEKAIKQIIKFLKNDALPHSILFSGPSGCGKTTIARILKGRLKCSDQDFDEINAAESRGIDTIRDIKQRVRLSPAMGTCRIWLVDECHKLTSDSQHALLKILEDVPKHVYFFLCTTDPQKIIAQIRTRTTDVVLGPVSDENLNALLTSIASKEKAKIGIEVIDKIIEVAGGSAREAVKLLNSALQHDTDEERLEQIEDPVLKRQAFDLIKAMIYDPKPTWQKIAKVVTELNVAKTDREGFRHHILSICRTLLMKGDKFSPLAYFVIDAFSRPWFGYEEAALEHACFEVYQEFSQRK